jgi:hypothetical protein
MNEKTDRCSLCALQDLCGVIFRELSFAFLSCLLCSSFQTIVEKIQFPAFRFLEFPASALYTGIRGKTKVREIA